MQKWLFLMTLIASNPVLPSWADDCAQAVDQHSMNQCAYDGWQAADKELNEVYASAREILKTIDSDLPEDAQGAVAALRDGQRAWIIFRDKTCEAEGYLMHGGSAEPLLVYGCMQGLTEQRIAGLRAIEDL